MAINTKRQQILEKVSDISDDGLLDTINKIIDDYQLAGANLERLVKPTRKTLDIEQLKTEQNYQGLIKLEQRN